jgi:hypothetical protein
MMENGLEEGAGGKAKRAEARAAALVAEAKRGAQERRVRRRKTPRAYHLYVLEIIGVGTKVGITEQPLRRLAAHALAARQWRRELGRQWVSIAHLEAGGNEYKLVTDCDSDLEFTSASFDEVMALVEGLKMTTKREYLARLAVRDQKARRRAKRNAGRRKHYFETYWEDVAAAREAKPSFDPRGVMSRSQLAEVSR